MLADVGRERVGVGLGGEESLLLLATCLERGARALGIERAEHPSAHPERGMAPRLALLELGQCLEPGQ